MGHVPSTQPFWQCFVFENLEGVYPSCGFFHQQEEGCWAGGTSGGAAIGLNQENVVRVEEPEGLLGVEGPCLGPWLPAIQWHEVGAEMADEGWKKMGVPTRQTVASRPGSVGPVADSERVNPIAASNG